MQTEKGVVSTGRKMYRRMNTYPPMKSPDQMTNISVTMNPMTMMMRTMRMKRRRTMRMDPNHNNTSCHYISQHT